MYHRWWLGLAFACGSKAEPPPTLPATITYALTFEHAPESPFGPIDYAVQIGDQVYDLAGKEGGTFEVSLPSTVSLLSEPASVLIKGMCKTRTTPTILRYLDSEVTAKTEQRYLAKQLASSSTIAVSFSVHPDAVKPYMPIEFATRIYIDRGDAKTVVKIGKYEVPIDQAEPKVPPDCEGAPILLGDKQVNTYRSFAGDFAHDNPSTAGEKSRYASLFLALDPARCYQWATQTYGDAAFHYTINGTLAGGAVHVIPAREVEAFLEPAPKETYVKDTVYSAYIEEILQKPCRSK
jgi:hypothetical protein